MNDRERRRVEAMERAVVACQQVLVDYQTGLLDEQQLRRLLYSNGLLLGDGEAWLLDVESGGWTRYDGIVTERFQGAPDGGDADPAFDAATLRRWQEGLRELLPAHR